MVEEEVVEEEVVEEEVVEEEVVEEEVVEEEVVEEEVVEEEAVEEEVVEAVVVGGSGERVIPPRKINRARVIHREGCLTRKQNSRGKLNSPRVLHLTR